MDRFLRWCGVALAFGAILLILMNTALTPSYMQAFRYGEAAARASDVYLLRVSAALLVALLLLFGCLGVHLSQQGASGRFGATTFVIAFVGTALLFAGEWANLIVLRAVAETSPASFEALNTSRLLTLGYATVAAFFAIGWMLFATSVWRARVLPRWPAQAVLGGMLLIPALGTTALGVAGQVTGNVVLGIGLAGLGVALIRRHGTGSAAGAAR